MNFFSGQNVIFLGIKHRLGGDIQTVFIFSPIIFFLQQILASI